MKYDILFTNMVRENFLDMTTPINYKLPSTPIKEGGGNGWRRLRQHQSSIKKLFRTQTPSYRLFGLPFTELSTEETLIPPPIQVCNLLF